MDRNALNQRIARIVMGKKMITPEQLNYYAENMPPGGNLGQILVRAGVLSKEQYYRLVEYIKKQASESEERPAGEPAATPQPTAQPVREVPASPGHKSRKTPLSGSNLTELPSIFRESGRKPVAIQAPKRLNKGTRIEEILIYARAAHASDVHFAPHSAMMMRRYGRLETVSEDVLSSEDIRRIVAPILSQEQLQEVDTTGDLEFSYNIPGYGRYRATIAEQRQGWDFSCRVVDNKIRSFAESGMPASCESLTHWAQGMVLITGPMGCGKTSSLATLVDLVNESRDDHIISIENPIEYVIKPKRCQITQRELGRHTLSNLNALKGALRQDPDILVVSELRDLETIRLAVSAAETGHLVFGTMNTANAVQTISRLIESFPPAEQEITRVMISESLRGIISQQLIPRKDGTGQIPVFEVMMVNKAVSNLIRKDALTQIESAMLSGKALGMVQLDDSLKQAVSAGLIEGREAFFRASSPKNFKEYAPEELKGMLDG